MAEQAERVPADNELISFGTLARAAWAARWYILVGLILGAIAGVALAFSMTRIYRADVVVVPVRSSGSGGISGALGQFSGIAAIAGLDLNTPDNTIEYQQYLRSRSLTRRFIEINGLLPELFPKLWNPETKTWRLQENDRIPTMSDAVSVFNRRVRDVSEDKRTNVITLAMNWRDPARAASWANAYVQLANRELAQRAVADAQSTVKYLNGTLENATTVGVQQSVSRLLEEQLQTIALANTRRDFAFRVVDPAVAPELDDFVKPARGVIVFALGVGGGMLGIGAWLLLGARRQRRAEAG
jgi:uncharacterized protein involved in exopolysaccharide biosynthesis